MQDIQSVVYRCQQGHLDAFTTLFNHYQDRIFDLACAIVRDEMAAEDMVQDTFMAVFQKIGGYRGESRFDTWLTAIAVNHCRMSLRNRKIRRVILFTNASAARAYWTWLTASNPIRETLVIDLTENQRS